MSTFPRSNRTPTAVPGVGAQQRGAQPPIDAWTWPQALLTLRNVLAIRGVSRSKHYADIKNGTYTRPVVDGRCSRWPVSDVRSLNDARISGASKDDLIELVRKIEASRRNAS